MYQDLPTQPPTVPDDTAQQILSTLIWWGDLTAIYRAKSYLGPASFIPPEDDDSWWQTPSRKTTTTASRRLKQTSNSQENPDGRPPTPPPPQNQQALLTRHRHRDRPTPTDSPHSTAFNAPTRPGSRRHTPLFWRMRPGLPSRKPDPHQNPPTSHLFRVPIFPQIHRKLLPIVLKILQQPLNTLTDIIGR